MLLITSSCQLLQIHHFLDFVKQIYKELPKVVVRSFNNNKNGFKYVFVLKYVFS